MNKDAFYFPHFSNARHDRKVKRVIKELGVEGYGIYFMLLEVLREQPQMQYPMDDIDLLADEFRTSEQKVKTVICNYRLFDVTVDEKFFSPKLIEYMGPYFKMKAQRQEAGIKSGRARQMKALGEKNPERPFNDRSTTVQRPMNKVKESKGKESKENKKRYLSDFENFRKLYPGVKRGSETEFNDFQKHKDWADVVTNLPAVIQDHIADRKSKEQRGEFVPQWKHLKTWLSQRCWEEEIQKPKPKPRFQS